VAKSKAEAARPARPAQPHGYLHWSRDPAVGLFAVLPLWIAYEGLRWLLSPDERNGAEVLLLDVFGRLGSGGVLALRVLFLLGVVAAAVSLVRRQIPWARVAMVSALEGMVYGLLLGPLAGALTVSAGRMLAAGNPLVQNLLGALGAGIFEELVFRLLLMSALFYLWARATKAFALPRWLAAVLAVLLSAVLFSGFHHLWGERFVASVFLFRAMAGVLLGVIFWSRGYGVVVYTPAMYDVYSSLTPRGGRCPPPPSRVVSPSASAAVRASPTACACARCCCSCRTPCICAPPRPRCACCATRPDATSIWSTPTSPRCFRRHCARDSMSTTRTRSRRRRRRVRPASPPRC
jgi:membrane protease YdiL (CAAX protease family)